MIMRSLSTDCALSYCIFWKKPLLLACVVVSKYVVFIWILEFQWLMQVHQYKYLQDYRRPFSRCKPNEEWPHIALLRYNESEKEHFIWKGWSWID